MDDSVLYLLRLMEEQLDMIVAWVHMDEGITYGNEILMHTAYAYGLKRAVEVNLMESKVAPKEDKPF